MLVGNNIGKKKVCVIIRKGISHRRREMPATGWGGGVYLKSIEAG